MHVQSWYFLHTKKASCWLVVDGLYNEYYIFQAPFELDRRCREREREKTRPCDYSSEDDSIVFAILYLNAIQNLDCLASGCVRACARARLHVEWVYPSIFPKSC